MKGQTSPSTPTILKERDGPRPRFVLASCRRCRGDLVLERDVWGEEYVCLQCGHEEAVPPTPSPSPEHDESGVGEERPLEADVPIEAPHQAPTPPTCSVVYVWIAGTGWMNTRASSLASLPSGGAQPPGQACAAPGAQDSRSHRSKGELTEGEPGLRPGAASAAKHSDPSSSSNGAVQQEGTSNGD